MTTIAEYNPATAMRAFYADRDDRRPARVWANEAMLHDLAAFGFEFFEGPGTNPTGLIGYASTKLWLRVSAGVTTAPGEIRKYNGSGDATLLASWPVMDRAALADYIGVNPDRTFTQTGTGAVGRPYLAKLRDCVSLLDFYNDDTRASDATSALNAALAAHRSVYIPPCKTAGLTDPFVFGGTINIVQNGQKLWGEGCQASIISASTAANPLISIADGLNGVEITGLHLKRSVAATSGGYGISCVGGVSNCNIMQNYIQDQYHGMVLRSADWGYIENNTIIGCYSHGVLGTNTTFAWAWQWDRNLITRCDGDGLFFIVSAVPGAPAACPVGRMGRFDMFALNGYGIRVVGSASIPVTNFALSDSFIGSTGNSAVYLDTYEGYHSINGLKIEQVGVDPTGRNYTTSPSGVGHGIELSANNSHVGITGGHIQTISRNGILAACDVVIGSPSILNCGVSGVAGQRNGIHSAAGIANIVGGRVGNLGAGTSQQYAVRTANGVNLAVVGVNMNANSVGQILADVNSTWVHQAMNFPATVPWQVPQTGIRVGAAAVGTMAQGNVIVEGNLIKNSTNYNNP